MPGASSESFYMISTVRPLFIVCKWGRNPYLSGRPFSTGTARNEEWLKKP
jgi:hypothetical protein